MLSSWPRQIVGQPVGIRRRGQAVVGRTATRDSFAFGYALEQLAQHVPALPGRPVVNYVSGPRDQRRLPSQSGKRVTTTFESIPCHGFENGLGARRHVRAPPACPLGLPHGLLLDKALR